MITEREIKQKVHEFLNELNKKNNGILHSFVLEYNQNINDLELKIFSYSETNGFEEHVELWIRISYPIKTNPILCINLGKFLTKIELYVDIIKYQELIQLLQNDVITKYNEVYGI